MGVTGLWPVLTDLCERKPLSCLSGKKVAVDLSGWVVEAYLCKGLNNSKHPHLRNLFFRVSSLLKLGVHPIFVMEGKPPSIKEVAFKKRNFSRETETNSTSSISRQTFDNTLKQCQDLLNSLGVPCIRSSGEAEAFCAFLNLNGVVDGVITNDNDAFLYGADVVYRDFSSDPKDSHVNVYSLKSDKSNKHQLDRNKLVALALLLGCDYSEGVPGVGKETALKLFSELNCNDVLQRFKDWKNLSESQLFPGLLDSSCIKKEAHCSRCGHLGSSSKHKKEGCLTCDSQFTCYLSKPCNCSWHVNEELVRKWKIEKKVYDAAKNCPDFPNMEVINEYLNYTDNIPFDESIDWNCPDMLNFQERAFNYLGWTFESSFEKVLPLITSWQLFKLTNKCGDEMNFIYEPVKVVKEQCIRGVNYLKVQWKLLDDLSDVPADNLTTSEDKDRFSACYKEIVDEYYKLKSDLKEQKQSKKKGKRLKSGEENRKIDEFFVQKS